MRSWPTIAHPGAAGPSVDIRIDTEGRITSSEVRSAPDGVLQSSTLTDWLDANNSYDYERDDDGDGVADYLQQARFDADAQVLTYWYDEGADGVREFDGEYEWHPDGHGTTTQDFTIVDPDYGEFSYSYETTYGADGRVDTDLYTSYNDYGPDFVSLDTYTWMCP